ncbi:MAG TPA: SMP-30/gluconolactonase/LRE family protein [Victivallales bacterium]|nr:SMP-30/gluconolactonase/LRE family protein [Victivallales bacterium]
MKTEVLIDGLVFPECPRWHNNRLWFSNIFADQILSCNMSGDLKVEFSVPSIGIDWLPDGRLVYVENNKNKPSIMIKDESSFCKLTELTNISPYLFNDMVISKEGNIYTGNTGCKMDSPENIPSEVNAPIAIINEKGEGSIAAENLNFPNGMIITPDTKKLIVAETFASKLSIFDILDNGELENKEIFAELDDKYHPDGICLDSEGAVWVATNHDCIRVEKGGNITHCIETVGACPLACMLGGEDRKTLFICTIDQLSLDVDLLNELKTGRIEIVNIDTASGTGMP